MHSLWASVFLGIGTAVFPALCDNLSYTSLDTLFDGQLANLSDHAPPQMAGVGSQDFGYCCKLAVNESLQIVDGKVSFRPGQTHLVGTIEELVSNPFPCENKYEDGPGYVPQVWVSYAWCSSTCPGWLATPPGRAGLDRWLKPLVLFIIPAVVFCLEIPRRRRLNVPQALFPRRSLGIISAATLALKVLVAGLIASIDIVIWTVVTVTFAGPMMVSGLYEAILDEHVIRYFRSKVSTRRLSVQQRAHLLLILLFGSIDVQPAWDWSEDLVSSPPKESLRHRKSSAVVASTLKEAAGTVTSHADGSDDQPRNHHTPPLPERVRATYPAEYQASINLIKRMMISAVEAQASFGSTAGAAVIFYCGNFVYTLLELQGNYGEVQLGHYLAFGMTWTIIPHVAIVSSLLLGCNNVSVWDTATLSLSHHPHHTSSDDDDQPTSKRYPNKRPSSVISSFFYNHIFTTTSESSATRTAWIWNRGQAKHAWVVSYARRYPHLSQSIKKDIFGKNLRSASLLALILTIPLIVVPIFLGGMVSYTTPMVGLGCRSITLLVYASAQVALAMLWTCKMKGWSATPLFWRKDKSRRSFVGVCVRAAWLGSLSFNIFISFFSGVMGTVFVVASMYANCFCATPAKYWPNINAPEAINYMSWYSVEQIANAELFWTPAGIGATCLLTAMAYSGWWYSRTMRDQFKSCVEAIDMIDVEDLAEDMVNGADEEVGEEERHDATTLK